MDPLSSYQYPYTSYEHLQPIQSTYDYNVKLEPQHNQAPTCQPTTNNVPANNTTEYKYDFLPAPPVNIPEKPSTTNINQEDSKEDIKPIIDKKRRQKKGKTSSYWNKKITDENFPFYGCTICNVSFSSIPELDQHVTIHKGRLTSYDIRLRNQLKRKRLKKQLKKQKKLKGKKVKTEALPPDIEIKPEDGYIGEEKASEFGTNTENASENVENSGNVNQNTSEGDRNQISEDRGPNKEDPRLQKLFKCFACQKQFSLSYYLKLHVRSHTDEKPYTCAECGQSFITASKLGRHNKRIHLAIRYQCRICYRYFSRFEYLTRHFDKKHPDDKLEGEPYDYNAILPYLKELEQELKEKAEAKDEKPKAEDLWSEWPGVDQLVPALVESGAVDYHQDLKDDIKVDADSPHPRKVHVLVEEVQVSYDTEVEVKLEKQEVNDVASDAGDAPVDDGFQDDNLSDDDFFPSNTWAATPPMDAPTSPAPPKMRFKSSDFPLKCEFCEKTINSASYMKVHLRTHTGEKPFKCYLCGRGFITSSKMHRHVLTHSESLADGESQVKQEDKIKTEIDEDVKQEGNTKKRKASIKKTKAIDKNKLRDGVRRKKEYQKRPHACLYCSKRFLHYDTLQVHLKGHIGETLVLKCNFCLEELQDEAALREHEATHGGARPYLCNICGRVYTKKETMVYHRKSHSDQTDPTKKEFVCDICSKSFNAQCKLQRHLVSHRADKFVLRYECPVCAHMFNTKYHVQMHLNTHQKEGLILEENRNEILAMVLQNARKIPKKTDSTLNITDLIPADERSRVCNICGEVFQHFYYLEEHLKGHGSKIAIEDNTKAEEKKHICQICNKGFKLHYYLKLHSFTHTKEKPFICQQCGKGFITKGKLKRHLETHSGLKKYQCHICYKFFTRPSYLRIHVRTIHGTQDYNFRLDKQYMTVHGM